MAAELRGVSMEYSPSTLKAHAAIFRATLIPALILRTRAVAAVVLRVNWNLYTSSEHHHCELQNDQGADKRIGQRTPGTPTGTSLCAKGTMFVISKMSGANVI